MTECPYDKSKLLLRGIIMRKSNYFLALCCTILVFAGLTSGQEVEDSSLTIYNANFAVVTQNNQFDFEKGLNTILFEDVAASIDATSVQFWCIDSPQEVRILEQSYEQSTPKQMGRLQILSESVGQRVALFVGEHSFMGKLRAVMNSEIILEDSFGNISVVSNDKVGAIRLEEPDDDLEFKEPEPAKRFLRWLLDSDVEGLQNCRIAYMADNIDWQAHYSLTLDADEESLMLSSWVTVSNKTETAFENASIQLVAGDIQREAPKSQVRYDSMVMARAEAAAPQQFEQKELSEYHLYTLERATDIPANQTKQLKFMKPADDVAVEKIYVYEKKPTWFYNRQNEEDSVQVRLEFENSEENNLGVPLPMGKMRIFQTINRQDAPKFIGEDRIGHTAKDERVSLYIGNAFDIVPEYTLVESESDQRQRYERQAHRIELRNAKDSDVVVFVEHTFSAYRNWEVEESSHDYQAKDANTIRFSVSVPAESATTVTYRTMETW